MFASRGVRLSALLIALTMALSVAAVDTAEARRGGSFGSRGTRTIQTVPATPTAPNAAAPVQRTMTNSQSTAANRAAPAANPRPGLFGGFGGALLGGLLFTGLFGMLFGFGFGGLGGLLALLAQVAIIAAIAWFFLRRRQPQAAMAGNAAGQAHRYEARPDFRGAGTTGAAARPDRSAASQRAGRRDEIGISDADLSVFESRLAAVQDAFSREDYDGLRRLTTPEMMSYLAEELGSNAARGVRNEVYDVRLLSGDIAEAWREGADAYATVALRYESRDVTRDRATGAIVSGEDAPTETTELWTFLRRNGEWVLSAIQEA